MTVFPYFYLLFSYSSILWYESWPQLSVCDPDANQFFHSIQQFLIEQTPKGNNKKTQHHITFLKSQYNLRKVQSRMKAPSLTILSYLNTSTNLSMVKTAMQIRAEVRTRSWRRMCFFLFYIVSKIYFTKRKAANRRASPVKMYSRQRTGRNMEIVRLAKAYLGVRSYTKYVSQSYRTKQVMSLHVRLRLVTVMMEIKVAKQQILLNILWYFASLGLFLQFSSALTKNTHRRQTIQGKAITNPQKIVNEYKKVQKGSSQLSLLIILSSSIESQRHILQIQSCEASKIHMTIMRAKASRWKTHLHIILTSLLLLFSWQRNRRYTRKIKAAIELKTQTIMTQGLCLTNYGSQESQIGVQLPQLTWSQKMLTELVRNYP